MTRPKLSELRGDDGESPPVEPARPAASLEAQKKNLPDPSPIGFFGDTRKFTRLGGWGSFGNAMGQFGFARATLISMPPVQEELMLNEEQKKKLKRWQEDMAKKGQEMGRSIREKNGGGDPMKAGENQPIAARIFQLTSMIDQVGSFVKENESGLAKILNASQRKRLSQIALQMEGISALTRPEIAEALGLLEEQHEQISQILTQSRVLQMTTWVGSMMSMRPPRKPVGEANGNEATSTSGPPTIGADPAAKAIVKAGPDASGKDLPEAAAKARAAREKRMRQGFETMRDQSDQIHLKATKEIVNLLSKAQRAKFELMLGPPFDPNKVNDLGRPPQGPRPTPPNELKPTTEKKPDLKG